MKKIAVIGSPDSHKNYRIALEKAGGDAVIFPDLSYVEKHFDSFDGLLLPGGGDVLSSYADYRPFLCRLTDCPDTALCGPGFFSEAYRACSDSNLGRIPFSDMLLTLEQFRALNLFCKNRKPVFGICKGMQLIDLYFRGTIREVSNPKLHRHPGKDTLHPADNLQDSFLHALFGPHMLVNSCHHQCVDSLGQNLRTAQLASDGTIEALAHLFLPVFGTQWHPERMPEMPGQDALLLFRYFISLL